jgi:uncharacterized protein (TIRG00374 family)
VERRRRALLVLRVAVSLGLIAILLTRFHVGSLRPHWQHSTAQWLAGGLAVTLGGVLLATLRWQRVIEALELRARMRTLLSHYFAGLFVGNVLPGSTVGADVLRVLRLSRTTGESPASFASVVLERLSGWIVLPVITLVALLLHPELVELGENGHVGHVALFVALATLGALTIVVAAAVHPRIGGRLNDNAGWRRFIGAVHLGLDRFRRHPAAAAGVILTGFAYQLAVVVAAWMAVEALGLKIGWAPILAFLPVVAIAQALPFSIGGLGIREGALFLFLQPLGVTSAQAITLGLLIYAMNLAVSLLGAPAFAVGARPARAAA